MSWYSYSDAKEKKDRVRREMEKRIKRGEEFTAFESPKGIKLTQNFWGQAWCRHLETYGGYETRLPRGRSYLRQGNVFNLTVGKGKIFAYVTGSELYEVEITITPLPAPRWTEIRDKCQGQVASLLDLLGGKLGDGVMRIICDPGQGLFPSRREIRHFCTCPDAADLCKHRAAVLYGVGVLFDRDPKFLFELRGTDPSELIANSAAVLTSSSIETGAELQDSDLSALFGIDIADDSPPPAIPVKPSPASTSGRARKQSQAGPVPTKRLAVRMAKKRLPPSAPS